MSGLQEHVKIVVVGDGTVGKTCILVCHTQNYFPQTYVPTVFENYSANVQVDGQYCSLSLWDTAGQEEYDRLRPLAYPQTDVFLLCFSLVNPNSFHNIKYKWHPEVKHHWGKGKILLVGTKKDLREDPEVLENMRESNMEPITYEMGMELAQTIKAEQYVECSALKMEGIKEVFDAAVRMKFSTKTEVKKTKKKKDCIIL